MTRKTATLLFTASALALGTHSAQAAEVIFSNTGAGDVQIGERVTQVSGVTQIKLDNGAMLSFVDGAEYRINADGSVDLFAGSVTVTGAPDGTAIVRMPDGAEGFVSGAASSASFSVNEEGESAGHTITGTAMVTRGRSEREFREGEFWESAGRRGLRQTVARATPEATPDAEAPVEVADLEEDGPVAAAQNGLPVSLGDALAAAGASSDILGAARNVDLAAGNPNLDTFPTGDLALLVAAAADLEGLNGGTPFPAAQADIIRTYLGFLADGGSGAQFLTTYAGFLGAYLDTIRAGNLPSEFGLASLADINAFLSYSGRTGTIDGLAAADRVLADRYLAFLATGGNVDQFASTFTGLVNAYFEFIRAGGDPDSFAGASQAVLDDYIAFLAASGLEQQLSDPDQTLLAAYNANGGLQFARDFQTALDTYFAFLQSGNLPSDFSETDLAVLQDYLEQLQAAGLLGEFLGDQASFYANYLAFVQGGGDPDAFTGLNANVFAGFAADLNAYYDYLLNGGAPSAYQPLSQQQIAAYIAALQAQGATDRFLDDLAGFYTDYAAFLAEGGDPDVFTGLPVLNLPAFADALNAYAVFLENGGLPAGFTATELDVLANYVSALQAAGEVDNLLGANADLLEAYFAFLANGGGADLFPGLPLYATYVDGLDAYFTFLNNGGLPADYAELTQAQIATFLAALDAAGGFEAQLGNLSSFYASYFAFIDAGNDPANFAGLPVYASYVTQLNAYFDFLAGGGLPADFGGLSQQVIAQYLAALNGVVGGLDAFDDLDMFADDYAAFILGGGDPVQFAGLPIYATYVTQLNAYFAFLANGGLPGDFTGLDQATIDAYLAALSNVTGGLDAFGALNGDFEAYIAFLLGGGDPAQFAGLPIYAQYVTQLNQYFAFLANGGLPGDFTGLDQATIDAYLAALSNVTGGLDAFGALNGDFDSYIAFLLGGGDPAEFAGLPVYAGYVTALNDYFAFLAAGGLPDDYTILDEATIEAYLAALTNVTGGLDSFNGLNSFFAAYSAFVLGGGDPEDFAGLPIYADYLTAVSEFYAFLLGGGLPSEFTGLTAQEVQDYLAALEGAGLLSTTFDGEVLTFFNDYLAFLSGGGVPDQFGGLPDGLINTFGNVYAAAFAPNAARAGAATEVALEDDGQITEVRFATGTFLGYPNPGDVLREHGRIGNTVAWTRYEQPAGNGTTNNNVHLLTGTPAVNLPASGTVQFGLVGGTAPTNAFADAGEVGFFEGALAVAFGSTSRIGLDFNVNTDTRGWNVQTAGGVADPTMSNLLVSGDSSFASTNQSVSISGTEGGACGGFCSITVLGSLFGDGATHAGFNYQIDDQTNLSNRAFIQGTAVFAAGATPIDGLGVEPDNGPTGDVRTGQYVVYVGADSTSSDPFGQQFYDRRLNVEATYDTVTGAPIGFVVNDNLDPELGGAELVDTGTDSDGNLSWGRWRNGVTGGTFFGQDNVGLGQSGLHIFSGRAATVLPTTGTILYDLIGSTTPTLSDGSTGTLDSAQAVVAFGSQAKLGLDFSVTADGTTYNVTTPGGLPETATNGLDVSATNIFGLVNTTNNGGLEITGTGSICSTSTCRVDVRGAFYGDDVATPNIGLAYDIGEISSLRVTGTFALGPNGEYTPPTTGVTHPANFAYTGGFDASGDRLHLIRAGTAEGFGSHTPEINADGELSGTTDNFFDTGSGGNYFDVQGDALGILGRFSGARVNLAGATFFSVPDDAGAHYIVLAPLTGMLPTNLMIEYDLIAATRPTWSDGAFAPGSFDGDLTVNYTSSFIDAMFTGAVEMTEADGQHIYEFSARIVERNLMDWVTDGSQTFSLDVTGEGRACPAGGDCQVKVIAGGGGENGTERVGIAYEIVDSSNGAASIEGAALFAEPGTYPNDGGGSGGGGGGSDFTGTREDIVYYSYTGGSLASAFGADAELVNGELVSATSLIGTLDSGDTTIVEAGDFGDVAFARWTDGEVTVPLFGARSIGANDGFHVMAGNASTILPASGKVDYTLAATTSATDNIGSAPGTVDGSLAIQFGATSLVGYNMSMEVGGMSWAVATPGGSADPSQSDIVLQSSSGGPIFGGTFSGNTNTVTAGGGACAISCLVTIAGAMYGENGAYAGVAMNVFDGTTGASGLAIFAAPGADTSSIPNTTQDAGTIAVAPTSDWDRWNVSDDTPITSGSDMAIAPGIDALQMRGIEFTTEQLQMLEAHLASQAQ